MPPQPNLNRLRYFTATVEAGSFTRAAERLGIAKTVVSDQVARLEQELHVALLKRTTRKLSVTETGKRFFDRATAILRDAEDAFGEVAAGIDTPTGTLTVTAPVDYGEAMVAPVLAAFLSRYSGMRAEIRFDDRPLDLIDADVDVAIRLGWLADSAFTARRLGGFRQLLVCAPAMGLDMGRSASPATLASLPWIGNRLLRHPLEWTFARGDDRAVVVGQAAVMANTTGAAHACILAGSGLGVLPDFVVERDLAKGRLVRLLPEWHLPEGGIHAVYPHTRFRPARVGAFVDLLAAREAKRTAVRR